MPQQFRTGDQTLVRELNRSIILNQLRIGSPLSRADLAAITGLNKTTVSSLVDELITNGFVREIGRNTSAGGRRVVSERAMKEPREAVQIMVSTFKSDACVMGGVTLVLHDVLSRPRLDLPLPSQHSEAPIRQELEPSLPEPLTQNERR
jgi:predicted transcriptional regulator